MAKARRWLVVLVFPNHPVPQFHTEKMEAEDWRGILDKALILAEECTENNNVWHLKSITELT